MQALGCLAQDKGLKDRVQMLNDIGRDIPVDKALEAAIRYLSDDACFDSGELEIVKEFCTKQNIALQGRNKKAFAAAVIQALTKKQ
jgi:hypothetical protein